MGLLRRLKGFGRWMVDGREWWMKDGGDFMYLGG